MIIGFSDNAWNDYQFWIQNDKKIKRNIKFGEIKQYFIIRI